MSVDKKCGPDLSVEIAGVKFKNPVITASGTFGAAREYSEWTDISALGGVTVKGISDVPWPGNATPRICETPSGMLNSIGLQNPGVDVFLERDLPFFDDIDTRVIVNVAGHSKEEYLRVVERLAGAKRVDMLELNVSCPNVKAGGMAMGTDAKALEDLTASCKAAAAQPLIVKLSPNVTDIREMAKAAEAGGADAISLINTLVGMKIDVKTRRFALAMRSGGLSGPAIRPVAVRMVYEAASVVNIPVIGMGGIEKAEDAIEFMLAGASAVAVGMANFYDPGTCVRIIDGIRDYMDENGFDRAADLTGAVRV